MNRMSVSSRFSSDLFVVLFAACGGSRPSVTTGPCSKKWPTSRPWPDSPNPRSAPSSSPPSIAAAECPEVRTGSPTPTVRGGADPEFRKNPQGARGIGLGEYLMADVPGPGAVVRLWTASISGRIRFYVDDMEHPLYEGEADAFFRRPYDVFPEMKAVDGGRFRSTVYQRDASYAPIPFAKRLRVIWIGKVDEIHFYHIQVRKYAAETAVVSFRPDDISKYKDTIDRVTLALADPDARPASPSAKSARVFEVFLAPGEKKEVLKLDGPGALERFSLRLQANDLDAALRQTVLTIVCDGYPQGTSPIPRGRFLRGRAGRQSLPVASLLGRRGRPDDLPVRHALREIPQPGAREPRPPGRPRGGRGRAPGLRLGRANDAFPGALARRS